MSSLNEIGTLLKDELTTIPVGAGCTTTTSTRQKATVVDQGARQLTLPK